MGQLLALHVATTELSLTMMSDRLRLASCAIALGTPIVVAFLVRPEPPPPAVDRQPL